MDKEKRKQLVTEYKLKPLTGGVYAVRNKETGSFYLKGDSNLEGSRNRFEFSKKTGCMYVQISREWETYGADAFEFVILEETQQKETESLPAFKDRLKKLEERWRTKMEEEKKDRQ